MLLCLHLALGVSPKLSLRIRSMRRTEPAALTLWQQRLSTKTVHEMQWKVQRFKQHRNEISYKLFDDLLSIFLLYLAVFETYTSIRCKLIFSAILIKDMESYAIQRKDWHISFTIIFSCQSIFIWYYLDVSDKFTIFFQSSTMSDAR